VLSEILTLRKFPIILGGEHTTCVGAVKSFLGSFEESSGNVSVLVFDAHLDMRDEYLGLRLSHATFMRRLLEEFRPVVVNVGVRAVCREELRFARERGVYMISSREILNEGTEVAVEKIKKVISKSDDVFLSIDMDVLDPAYAPAVQNPEPGGISTNMLLDILWGVRDLRIKGLEICEVTPNFDNGLTSLTAAKIICETICYIYGRER